MTDLANYQTVNQYESQISGELSSGTTAPFSLEVEDAPAVTLDAGQSIYFVIDPGTSKEEGIRVSAISGTTLTVAARGLPKYNGGAATTTTHSGGAKIIVTNNWQVFDDIATAVNSKAGNAEDETISGDWVFSKSIKVPVFADDTARDAAIASPANGMECYRTDTGKFEDYTAGSWVERESGGTFANASTTVAGKVEQATSAESKAGTDTGGTGAKTFVSPSDIAANVQNASYSFAADAEASDTYAITLAPAISAYATGQVFYFTANTANTGAATLNVNGKGAITIKKNHDQDLATGDIGSGQVVGVFYDGTNFQMLSQIASEGLKCYGGKATITLAASANYDTAVSTAGTPKAIFLHMGGTAIANDNGSYGSGQFKCGGQAMFIGDTLEWANYTTGIDAGSTLEWSPWSIGDTSIAFGQAPAANGHQITGITIENLSSTGCTIRVTNAKSGACVNGTFYVGYTVWV